MITSRSVRRAAVVALVGVGPLAKLTLPSCAITDSHATTHRTVPGLGASLRDAGNQVVGYRTSGTEHYQGGPPHGIRSPTS
jgi:hypothetical protein